MSSIVEKVISGLKVGDVILIDAVIQEIEDGFINVRIEAVDDNFWIDGKLLVEEMAKRLPKVRKEILSEKISQQEKLLIEMKKELGNLE